MCLCVCVYTTSPGHFNISEPIIYLYIYLYDRYFFFPLFFSIHLSLFCSFCPLLDLWSAIFFSPFPLDLLLQHRLHRISMLPPHFLQLLQFFFFINLSSTLTFLFAFAFCLRFFLLPLFYFATNIAIFSGEIQQFGCEYQVSYKFPVLLSYLNINYLINLLYSSKHKRNTGNRSWLFRGLCSKSYEIRETKLPNKMSSEW